MNKDNVFSGKNALIDFLNPDKNIPLPLVEIPDSLNPFYKDGVRIYAKLLNMLPLSNVKSLPAFNMLQEASNSGKLKDVNNKMNQKGGVEKMEQIKISGYREICPYCSFKIESPYENVVKNNFKTHKDTCPKNPSRITR